MGWTGFRNPLQGVAAVAGVAVAGCTVQVQNKEDLGLSESPVPFLLLLLQLQPLHLLHLAPVFIRHLGVQTIELLLPLGDELRPVVVFQHSERLRTCCAA